MKHKIITVFGGNGFLGRSLIQRLAKQGARVRVAVRNPEKAIRLRVLGEVGQITPFLISLADPRSIHQAITSADLVVNLCGRLFEKGASTFDLVHHQGPALIAKACADHKVKAFVHVSALGANPNAASLYAKSKGDGEIAIRKAFPQAMILRPSVLFGPDDRFFNRFAELATVAPFLVVFDGGKTKLQPVFVGDMAQAIVQCLKNAPNSSAGQCFELGGPKIYSFKELLQLTLMIINRKRPIISVPAALGHLLGLVAQYMPEPLITPDQIKLLQQDNVVNPTAHAFKELGIQPHPLEEVLPDYLNGYRPRF
jgi:Predicted nucleoside-diphosphate-sugar epimerases